VPKYFAANEANLYNDFLLCLSNPKIINKPFYFVLVQADKIIGAGGFGDKDKNGNISLAWGFIHLNYHKKGFGRLLLEYRLKQIEKLFPNNSVFLDTTQFTYRFYEKFGFEVSKISLDFYEKGMHSYDMVKLNQKK
jgi:predicted GNAT family N-acyltransferase